MADDGMRLIGWADILTRVPGRNAEQIFSGVDALKLRSCVTLFMHAAPGEPVFRRVLDKYSSGTRLRDRAADLIS